MSRWGRDSFEFYAETALGKAVYTRNYKKANILIKNGANVNSIEGNGTTPLHLAAHFFNSFCKNCDKIAELLINNGANLNVQDDDGKTPLHYSKKLSFIRLLINAGANVNIKDNEGRTPIFKAVNTYYRGSNTYDIELLLKHGARIDIKNNKGRSPLSIARDRNYTEILKLFKKYEKIE